MPAPTQNRLARTGATKRRTADPMGRPFALYSFNQWSSSPSTERRRLGACEASVGAALSPLDRASNC